MSKDEAAGAAEATSMGGYDEGYRACPMFWPDSPGSVLVELDKAKLLRGGRAIDLGCGEGTNAAWLDERGYWVDAVDVSALALRNAHAKYEDRHIRWHQSDATDFDPPETEYDLTVAYGLMHCLPEDAIVSLIQRVRTWTHPNGLVVIVSFNSRSQDLSGHPGFKPTLLPHAWYVSAFSDWEVLHSSDLDLYETHPHNQIPHHHSMTRLAIRRTP